MSEEVAIQAEVKNIDPAELRPYENNVKKHDENQVNGIARSIKAHGFDQPIVVDGAMVIIKGHGRWLASQALGMKKVPVVIRTDMTAKQAAASRLADNRVAEGGVDTEGLARELAILNDSGEVDMASMGFSDKELEMMTNDLGDMDENELMDNINSSLDETEDEEDQGGTKSEKGVKLSTIFNTTLIDGSQARRLTKFLRHTEAETGLEGVEAAVTWFEQLGEQV